MNKLNKIAISILVIASFLFSMIPIMPASAAAITIDEPTSTEYLWERDTGVVYSTVQAQVGSYSAFIAGEIGGDVHGLVIDEWPLTGNFKVRLGDISTLNYWSYLVYRVGVTNPQDVVIALLIDVDDE